MKLATGTVLMASLAVFANAETLSLLAQDIHTYKTSPIGTLNYDSDTGNFEISDVPEYLDHGDYRLGIQKGHIFKSYSYSELTEPFGYELIIITKPDGEVSTLSFKKSFNPGLTPVVKPMRPGPEPLIFYKKEPEISDISNPTAQDDEEPKTFLQKYWMYIFPVAIYMLLSAGEQTQKQAQVRD